MSLTTRPQDAVFRIGLGWVGGMGGYPVFEKGTSSLKFYGDAPIFFDDDQAEEILSRTKMPTDGYRPSDSIVKIAARVRLRKRRGVNPSLPPPEPLRWFWPLSGLAWLIRPRTTYYIARMLKLYDVIIKFD